MFRQPTDQPTCLSLSRHPDRNVRRLSSWRANCATGTEENKIEALLSFQMVGLDGVSFCISQSMGKSRVPGSSLLQAGRRRLSKQDVVTMSCWWTFECFVSSRGNSFTICGRRRMCWCVAIVVFVFTCGPAPTAPGTALGEESPTWLRRAKEGMDCFVCCVS